MLGCFVVLHISPINVCYFRHKSQKGEQEMRGIQVQTLMHLGHSSTTSGVLCPRVLLSATHVCDAEKWK